MRWVKTYWGDSYVYLIRYNSIEKLIFKVQDYKIEKMLRKQGR